MIALLFHDAKNDRTSRAGGPAVAICRAKLKAEAEAQGREVALEFGIVDAAAVYAARRFEIVEVVVRLLGRGIVVGQVQCNARRE